MLHMISQGMESKKNTCDTRAIQIRIVTKSTGYKKCVVFWIAPPHVTDMDIIMVRIKIVRIMSMSDHSYQYDCVNGGQQSIDPDFPHYPF